MIRFASDSSAKMEMQINNLHEEGVNKKKQKKKHVCNFNLITKLSKMLKTRRFLNKTWGQARERPFCPHEYKIQFKK